MSHKLAIHEEFMLLALREETGTFRTSRPVEYSLAAAILSELLLNKYIELDDSRKKNKLVIPVKSSGTGNQILDESLQKINEAKRRGSLKTWVVRIANIKKLKHRIARELCHKSILRTDEDKVLLIFTRKIYPELNPHPELELVERLRNVIFTDSDNVKPEDAILIALAKQNGLLRKKFDKQELKSRKDRIKMISEGSVTAKATKEVMDAIAAVVITSVVVPG